MFQPDNPIKLRSDDTLGRKKFAELLGQKILEYQEKSSLVIGLYGQWGSGKTSLINMILEYIEETSNLNNKSKPIFIKFNPWNFSEQNQLILHFLDQLSSTLGKGDDSKTLKKVGNLLQTYAKILKPLTYIPSISGVASLGSDLCETVGSASIKSGELIEKDLNGLKEELFEILEGLDRKIIIVIDDIDRLSQPEIKQVFKLVKINADFPNTIYILAFDDQVVTKNLNEQANVSGRDYLNKIVQVSFNIPHVKQHKISEILFAELDKILVKLPKSHYKYFDELHWTNIYHSGLKNFFKSIRDVKRFSNSLEFNISLMYKDDSMEVNPVDFIAIESIRVFCPDFYFFMKSRNTLFTDIRDRGEIKGKEEIEVALDKIDKIFRDDLKSLLFVLFPQMSSIFGNTSYEHGWQSIWNKQLRVCATNYFDAYFTLIPGGDEKELSQYELDLILKQISNPEKLENSLLEYIKTKKIRRVLQRLQDYADDEDQISIMYAENIVQVLFNISDLVPNEKEGMWDFGADMDCIRIIFQVMKRQRETTKNYEILKNTICKSKGLAGPVRLIFLQSKERNLLVPAESLAELQHLCVSKIKEFRDEKKLINNNTFVDILFRWKEWDTSKEWDAYVEDLISTDEGLLKFIEKFITDTYSHTFGNYGYSSIKRFSYESLSYFVKLELIIFRLESIKKANSIEYKTYNGAIDLFLNNYKTANIESKPSETLNS